jgi:hypothetical protein
MPAPAHIRLTFSGTFGSTDPAAEEWSFGVGVDRAVGLVARDLLEAFAVECSVGAWNAIKPGIGSYAVLRRVRAAHVGDDGRVTRDTLGAYRQGDALVSLPGGGTVAVGSVKPFQVALAVSTRSAFAGPTGRGRFYLPAPIGSVVTPGGVMSAGDQTAHEARAVAFLDAVNTAADAAGYGRCVVASGGSIVYGFPPALHVISHVGVGQAFDTLRSRRGDLPDKDVTPTPLGWMN